MNILFICNTYFQLIVAIQMRRTIMHDDKVYVVVTDKSHGSQLVAERLQTVDLFEGVFFQKVREPAGKRATFAERVEYVWCGVVGSKSYAIDKRIVFDKIIGFNFDLHFHFVYAIEKKKNGHLLCEKMEEGILSYKTEDSSSGVMQTIYKIRGFLGLGNLKKCISTFYCFCPEAYKGTLQTYQIPKIQEDDQKLKDILYRLFIEGNDQCKYLEKYIYLPCIYDIEGGAAIGELSLAKKIADAVGRDNLLVKVHPRDNVSKYVAEGLKVAEASSAPWEALLIYYGFSDKVLLSSLSGSLLTTSTLLANPPESHYLYPLCDLSGNKLAVHYKNVIESILLENKMIPYTNLSVSKEIGAILP